MKTKTTHNLNSMFDYRRALTTQNMSIRELMDIYDKQPIKSIERDELEKQLKKDVIDRKKHIKKTNQHPFPIYTQKRILFGILNFIDNQIPTTLSSDIKKAIEQCLMDDAKSNNIAYCYNVTKESLLNTSELPVILSITGFNYSDGQYQTISDIIYPSSKPLTGTRSYDVCCPQHVFVHDSTSCENIIKSMVKIKNPNSKNTYGESNDVNYKLRVRGITDAFNTKIELQLDDVSKTPALNINGNMHIIDIALYNASPVPYLTTIIKPYI